MVPFKETQKITQWWVWAILLAAMGLVLGGIVQEVMTRALSMVEFLQNPELWASTLILLLVLVFFYLFTLRTEVGPEGIRIRYFPLWRTTIPWEEVASAEIIQYGFVGYGIRLSFRYGTVYNAQGNRGLQIVKKNGSKILLGTQRPAELKAAVDQFL